MITGHKPAKCAPGRDYAHHTDIDRQAGKYSWGACRHCGTRRLFRNSWPDIPDWPREREDRLREERKRRRKERRSEQQG